MRIAEGKTNCLWLDYTSTTYELGPVNTIRGRNASQKGETAKGEPCKHCSNCGEKNPVYMSECLSCGEPFSPNQSEKAVGNQSGNAEIIDDGNAKWANVTGLGYVRHTSRKSGKSTCVLIITPIYKYIQSVNIFVSSMKAMHLIKHIGGGVSIILDPYQQVLMTHYIYYMQAISIVQQKLKSNEMASFGKSLDENLAKLVRFIAFRPSKHSP